MTTKLDKALKREIKIDSRVYTVTIDPGGVKVTEKGKRKGPSISWQAIINGDATLNEALRISLDAYKT